MNSFRDVLNGCKSVVEIGELFPGMSGEQISWVVEEEDREVLGAYWHGVLLGRYEAKRSGSKVTFEEVLSADP